LYAPSPTETGNQSEQKVQRLLAGEGIKAELGWVAHAFGLTIQLDLVDIKNKNVYEVKPGTFVPYSGKDNDRFGSGDNTSGANWKID